MADDFDGRVFGRLTVVKQVGTNKHHKRIWLCRCECGAETQTLTGSLTSGRTVSCGCVRKERTAKLKKSHGSAPASGRTPEYNAWAGIIARCTNPKTAAYKWYGARGIGLCDRWLDFNNFLADMGRRPPGMSIDRINNDLGYSPENCRWATHTEQTRNQRSNVKIAIDGVTRCMSEWCEINGVCYSTARRRMRMGVNPEVAVTLQGRLVAKRIGDHP